MSAFELGRVLYEARVRTAWSFGPGTADARLAKHPYPRHPADPDPACQSAEVELAQAQAKEFLRHHRYDALPAPDLETIARVIWFAMTDSLDEASALSPGNDGHWQHWKAVNDQDMLDAFMAARATIKHITGLVAR